MGMILFMKQDALSKIGILAVVTSLLFGCASTQSTRDTEELIGIQFPEGQNHVLANDNLLYTRGRAHSAPGLKTPIAKEASAKEAARQSARQAFLDYCYPVSPDSLPGPPTSARNDQNKGKIILIHCEPESPADNLRSCMAVLMFDRAALLQECRKNRENTLAR